MTDKDYKRLPSHPKKCPACWDSMTPHNRLHLKNWGRKAKGSLLSITTVKHLPHPHAYAYKAYFLAVYWTRPCLIHPLPLVKRIYNCQALPNYRSTSNTPRWVYLRWNTAKDLWCFLVSLYGLGRGKYPTGHSLWNILRRFQVLLKIASTSDVPAASTLKNIRFDLAYATAKEE